MPQIVCQEKKKKTKQLDWKFNKIYELIDGIGLIKRQSIVLIDN